MKQYWIVQTYIYLDIGSTVTISSPHFYQSDDALWQMFDGISDPKEKPESYETYMYIEPFTGAALSLHKRIQVDKNDSSKPYK